ncbi:MAG: MFS transporter, partial [Ktedonobacterales bacterium]
MSGGALPSETVATPPSLWRHRLFLRLWTGQTISLVGSQVTLLALPLTAVLTLRASAFQMGVLRALQYAPALLIGLFAGVYIDRLRRRPILMGADVGRALLLGSIPLVAALGALTMGYLEAIAFLVGSLSVIFEAAYLAFLPALVGRAQLVDANGKLEASQSVSRIVGPGFAGLLIQLLTAPIAIIADAASFVVSV